MITAYRLLLIIGLLFQIGVCVSSVAAGRERISFNKGWRFDLSDQAGAEHPDYDDSSWRLLDLPHDWSIEGDFSADNPSGTGAERYREEQPGTEKHSERKSGLTNLCIELNSTVSI